MAFALRHLDMPDPAILPAPSLLIAVTGGPGTSKTRLLAELARLGRPMQTIDIQIAAIALTLGNCIVVSADSDLSAVPGLSVEHWTDANT